MMSKFYRDNVHRIRLHSGKIPQLLSYIPERVMPGSFFHQTTGCPKFQADVYTLSGDKMVPRGQGFLTKGEWFVTAHHVLGDDIDLVLKTVHGEVVISRQRFQQREGDIAVARLTAQERGSLQLAQAKLYGYAQSSTTGTMVNVQAFGKQSIGTLKHHEAFGFVTYTGSTIPGFSGAPYYFGNIVYGMHTGGMAQNIGYESAYLDMLFRSSEEDSAEWLIETAERGMRFEYDRSPYDPDEYRVIMGDRYHIVDSDTLEELLRKGKGKQMKKIVSDDELDYDLENFDLVDVKKMKSMRKRKRVPLYRPEGMENDAVEIPLVPRGALSFNDSGNGMPTNVAPALASGKTKEPLERVLQRLNTSPKEPVVQSLKPSGSSDTTTQRQMPAQPSDPSDFTQDDSPLQLLKLGKKKRNLLFGLVSELLESGEQTLALQLLQTCGLSTNSPPHFQK